MQEDAGDLGSVPGLGGSPGEGNGNPLQYFLLGNPTDRGVYAVHGGLTESDKTQQQQKTTTTNDKWGNRHVMGAESLMVIKIF